MQHVQAACADTQNNEEVWFCVAHYEHSSLYVIACAAGALRASIRSYA